MIVFYIPDLRPGGAENVMLQLVLFFRKQGKEVILLLGKKQGKLLDTVPKEINVVELGYFKARAAVFPLIRFCRKTRPDFLVTCLGASVAASLAKPFLPGNLKLISRLGNTFGEENRRIRNPAKRMLHFLMNKTICFNSALIICQSQYMAVDYTEHMGNSIYFKLKVIYNPLNLDKLNEGSKNISEKFDLVAVGRLMEQKDYPTMLNAVKILNDTGIPIRLGIIGEGLLINDLIELCNRLGIKEFVKFLGYKKYIDIYIREAKFLISTSVYEGFSNVIAEALAVGTPVIATDCPSGNREIINESNGIFCEVGNPSDVAAKIKKGLIEYHAFDREKIARHTLEKFDPFILKKTYFDWIMQP